MQTKLWAVLVILLVGAGFRYFHHHDIKVDGSFFLGQSRSDAEGELRRLGYQRARDFHAEVIYKHLGAFLRPEYNSRGLVRLSGQLRCLDVDESRLRRGDTLGYVKGCLGEPDFHKRIPDGFYGVWYSHLDLYLGFDRWDGQDLLDPEGSRLCGFSLGEVPPRDY